jgi:uncharacterized protein (TIGR04255 family)
MTERPSSLPDYRTPPVDEVIISVQFPRIEDFSDSNIREFWKLVRDEYPIGENQPRLEGGIESLEPSQPIVVQLQTAGQPNARMWMINDTDDFLIQVQNTRFIQNWRRRQGDYGHFEEIRAKFWNSFNKLQSFLADKELDQPAVQQVEVTYFNWIPNISMVEFFKPAGPSILDVADSREVPEEQTWTARYLLPNASNMIERLYVQCLPAIRPLTPGVKGSQLALIFRAARESGLTSSEVEAQIDNGRAVIVNAFTELTTSAAHDLWGRYK